jgi:UDP-N-acetylmuramate dehydrogenase
VSGDVTFAALLTAGLSRIARNEPLSKYTSWRVGGPADYFGVAEDIDALRNSIAVANEAAIPWIVLGGGSNVLVSDAGVEGLVIMNRIKTARMVEGGETGVFEGGSGLFFARAAQFTARLGFTGLEWGVAIPGTLGAGVVNNAGAHGGTVADTLIKAEALDRRGALTRIYPSDMAYTYRESKIKRSGGLVITASEQAVTRCWFRVSPCPVEQSMATIGELMGRRQETQPIAEPSGGSTFKNPDGAAAGSLIETAGLKGRREGGAELSPKHANFVVNSGAATASDVIELMVLAQRAVERRHGLRLEPEIQLLGRWEGDERVVELGAGQPAGVP